MKKTLNSKEHGKKLEGGNTKGYAPNGFIYEKTLIKSGLSKLGIDGSYEIVIADNPDIVENTAAETLQKFLGKGCVGVPIVPESKSTGKKRFLLGSDANLKAIARFGDSGALSIRDVSAEDDGFHLKRIGEDFVVAGANPRGVLYGVYAFEDFIGNRENGSLDDIRKVPHFRKRMSAPGHYFNRINFATEGLPEEKAAYLSRIGANQVVLLDIGVGGIPHSKLHTYVRSDIFTFQPSPSSDLQAKLKSAGVICKKYGIDLYCWFEEPVIPAIAGGIEKYPPEALGTVRRPWGGGKDGLEQTLCVNSPIVQEHYKNMVKKFVREYPDVKGFAFYNLDGSSWLCTPKLCGRCASAVKDSPHDLHNPWESQASFVTLLAQAAREERSDFDFRFWGSVHFNDSIEKLLHDVQGYDSLMCFWNGSDRDIIIPEKVEPDRSFAVSLTAAKERRIPLYGMIEFNNLEAIPNTLPFPFAVCNAIKRYEKRGLKHIMEFAGPIPGHNPINALVAQHFLWNPDQNPEEFLASLSVRQFGTTAGKLMYRAWEEMKKAFNVWNGVEFGPLSGSQMQLSIGALFSLPRPILADIVKSYNYDIEIRINVEPWRADGYQKLKAQVFLDKMQLMNIHLAQAAEQAKQAIAAASDKEFIGICYYEDLKTGRPTCKEYAELNYAPIAIADALCRQRCNILRAYHLLTAMENARAADDAKSVQAKEKLYLELIREDIGVQERFCALLISLAEKRPCYTRASLTEREISDLLSGTMGKIEKLNKFLKIKTGLST